MRYTTRSFNTLALEIKEFNKQKDFSGAVSHWNQEIKNGIVPDAFAYAAILSTFRHDNNVQAARFVMEEIKSRNILTSAIGNQMIDLYCRLNDMESAEELFDSMVHFQMDVRAYSLSTLIKSYANASMERSMALMEKALQMGLAVDDYIFSDLVKRALANRDIESTRVIVSFIKKMKIKLTNDLASAIMYSYAIMGDEKELKEISDWLLQSENNLENVVFHSLLSHYTFNNDVKKALEIENSVRSNGKYLNETSYQNLITVNTNSGRYQEALKLIDEVEKTSKGPLSHQFQEKLGFLEIMTGNVEKGLSKVFPSGSYSPPTLNKAIELLISEYAFDQAAALMKKAIEVTNPYIDTYNKIIRMYAEMDDVMQANEWFLRVKNSEVLNPTKHTYLPLIKMFERKNDKETVQQLQLEMENLKF